MNAAKAVTGWFLGACLAAAGLWSAPAPAQTPASIAADLGLASVDRVELLYIEKRPQGKGFAITYWFRIHFRNNTHRLAALGLDRLESELGEELGELRDLTGEQLRGLALASRELHREHRPRLHRLLDTQPAAQQDRLLALLGWLGRSGVTGEGLQDALLRGFSPTAVRYFGLQGLLGQLNAAHTLFNQFRDEDPVVQIDFERKVPTFYGDRIYDLVITTRSGRKIFVEVKANDSARRPSTNSEQMRRDLASLAEGREVRYLYSPNQAPNLGVVREAFRREWDALWTSPQAREWRRNRPAGAFREAADRFEAALTGNLVGTYERRPFSRAGELVE